MVRNYDISHFLMLYVTRSITYKISFKNWFGIESKKIKTIIKIELFLFNY